MATLEQHLKTSGETQADFAARIGVRQGTVSKLMRGHITPSLKLAQRIERATNRAVLVSSWGEPDPFDDPNTAHLQPAAPAAQPQEPPHVSNLQEP